MSIASSRQRPDLSSVVNTLGRAEFGQELTDQLRMVTGADIVSAFEFSTDNKPNYLLGGGRTPPEARFSEAAGQRYASGYWRFDRALGNVLSSSSRFRYKILFQRCYDIPNKEYRSYCYDSHEVLERASIFANTGNLPVMLNLYRCKPTGPFDSRGISEIEQSGELLCALIAKHTELVSAISGLNSQPNIGEAGRDLREACLGLSLQEIEVCAGLLAGFTYKEIAQRRNLKLSSVVTYRKRAYMKLGIIDREDLHAMYKRMRNCRPVIDLN